jgi:hypothetical protein
VVPNVLEQKEKKEKDIDEATKKILYTDTSRYIDDNNYDIIPGNIYCINVSTLINNGYSSVDATDFNNKVVKIAIDTNDNFLYSIVDECQELKNS